MENSTVVHFLKIMAKAITCMEEATNEFKGALCVLLGYFNEDDLNTVIQEVYEESRPAQTSYIGNRYQESVSKSRAPSLVKNIENSKNNSISEIETTIQSENGLLQFTEKEISKMPKKVKKFFQTQGYTVHYRKRTEGRYTQSYEIRYAKKPYNNPPITASGTTLEEAKMRFIEKLTNYIAKDSTAFTTPTNFNDFAMYWFENFHKRKVAEPTYNKNLATYKRDMQSAFMKEKVSEISPLKIQALLDRFNTKGRTKETLHSILNQIFVCAVKHGIVRLNPLDMCFYQKHERKHGKAISKDDERRLLAEYAGTPFQIDFAIALYTGLRPNEYATATIDGDFIKARNSKRKDGRTAFKRIPITPMLRPYLIEATQIKMHHPATITEKFKNVLPNNTLYDLRTTFQTRCTECGIAEVAIGLFMGNAIGGELKKAYTDVSDEWLLKEGEKLFY